MPAGAIDALDLRLVRRTAGRMPGEHRGLGVGVGTEIAQLRPYQIGDDVRRIDAAASARTGEPHVRQEVPERALTTWVVLDLSPSMAFGSADRLKSDVAEGVALVLGRLAVKRGGKLGLLTFGEDVPRVLPPRGGRRSLATFTRTVQQGVSADGLGGPHGLSWALRRVRGLARGPGLVVVVSDFREEGDGWRRPLRAVAAHHRVVCVEIVDPRERELPNSGLLVVVDPESGRTVEADTASAKLRERYAAREAARAAHVHDTMRRTGVGHVVLTTDRDWLRALGRAF